MIVVDNLNKFVREVIQEKHRVNSKLNEKDEVQWFVPVSFYLPFLPISQSVSPVFLCMCPPVSLKPQAPLSP